MIYNTRNQSNDTTESQKEKEICFKAHVGGRKEKLDSSMYSKQTNKMWSFKNLVMLRCESRTSLHGVKYK